MERYNLSQIEGMWKLVEEKNKLQSEILYKRDTSSIRLQKVYFCNTNNFNCYVKQYWIYIIYLSIIFRKWRSQQQDACKDLKKMRQT